MFLYPCHVLILVSKAQETLLVRYPLIGYFLINGSAFAIEYWMMLEMYLSCNVRMSRWENFIYLWYSFATTSG